MTIEQVYLATSVTGDVSSPANALGNTPTTWAGTANSNTSWAHTWGFGTPSTPTLLAGEQTVSITVRKGSNANNPTAYFSILRDGVTLATSPVTTVTSTSGQVVSASWVAAAGESTAGLQILVTTSANGGSPSSRNSVQMSMARWDADVPAPQVLAANGQVPVKSTATGSPRTAGSVETGVVSVGGGLARAKVWDGTAWVKAPVKVHVSAAWRETYSGETPAGEPQPSTSRSTFLGHVEEPADGSMFQVMIPTGPTGKINQLVIAVAWRAAGTTAQPWPFQLDGGNPEVLVSHRNTSGGNTSGVHWVSGLATGGGLPLDLAWSAPVVRFGVSVWSIDTTQMPTLSGESSQSGSPPLAGLVTPDMATAPAVLAACLHGSTGTTYWNAPQADEVVEHHQALIETSPYGRHSAATVRASNMIFCNASNPNAIDIASMVSLSF